MCPTISNVEPKGRADITTRLEKECHGPMNIVLVILNASDILAWKTRGDHVIDYCNAPQCPFRVECHISTRRHKDHVMSAVVGEQVMTS
jgi:hypothetical protein